MCQDTDMPRKGQVMITATSQPSQPTPISGRDVASGRFVKGRTGTTRTRDAARASRTLSHTIRVELGPEFLYRWNMLIAAGRVPTWVEDDNGDLHVIDEQRPGITPTLEQRFRAMDRLADRAYGMPVQALQLEAEIRTHAVSEVQIKPGAMSLGEVAAMRRARDEHRARVAATTGKIVETLPVVASIETTAADQPAASGQQDELQVETTAAGQHEDE